MSKRLLLVTYHFPPILSAGVSRVVGVSGYLMRKGWEITVLTVERAYSELEDEATLALIPAGIEVIRTGTLEIDRFNPRRLLAGDGYDDSPLDRKIAVSLLRYPYALLHRIGSYPERHAGWNVPLYKALSRLMTSRRYDVVLSSSPPHSLHLPLLFLRKSRPFRWVADFRDPWSAPPHYGRTGVLHPLTRRVEAAVLKRCDHVIANTPGNRRVLLETFPFLDRERVTVVTNGFDGRGLVDSASPLDTGFDFLFTGEIYEGMLELFIHALRILRRRGCMPIPRLRLYGYIDERSLAAVREAGLTGNIVFEGRIDRERSIALMQTAPALLLTVPHNQRGFSWVPSKLYAYLFSRRPILGIAPAGDAADLIARTGTGRCITSRDPDVVANELWSFVTAVRTGTLPLERNDPEIANYRMDAIAARIESICDGLREKA